MLRNRPLAIAIAAFVFCACGESDKPAPPPSNEAKSEEPATPPAFDQLAAARGKLDNTVYRDERQAQAYERVLVRLWDQLRAGDAYQVFGQQTFETLGLLSPGSAEVRDWGVPGIRVIPFQQPRSTIGHAAFLQALDKWKEDGWILQQSEWHHDRFTPASGAVAAKSRASATGHLVNEKLGKRLILEAKLDIEWAPAQPGADQDALPQVSKIDVAVMRAIERSGDPPFSPLASFDIATASGGRWKAAQPILLHDLDGDGFSEAILAGANLIYRNKGAGMFEPEPLKGLLHPFDGAAIIADFTGDGVVDLLGTARRGGVLQLLAGTPGGGFAQTPQQCFPQAFDYAQGITAGDIDADGDLDIFVFQYRPPYIGGQMPTPYHDANDGFPSYLLRNDGGGKFTDVTEQSGLAAKRHRRTYSACFVDLDGDGKLDLSVVSDFAGLDVHRGDGEGGFTDVSDTMVDKRDAFGMAQTLDDFDADGALDLYMVGMSSTTARRIVALGIDHPGFPAENQLRSAMGYGNRLYLSRGGRLLTAPAADRVARTGWSWGVSSADFDNDGDRDLYVANGHVSGQSSQDYCTRFWSHDIFTDSSEGNPAVERLFFGEMKSLLQRQTSWNGYEKNALFLSDGGNDFLNAAFLLGVAYEFDSRAVASDDFDGDGLVDLLVVELDQRRRSEVVHLVNNRMSGGGHWLGVRLRESPGGPSPLGAKVFAFVPGGKRVAAIVAGDSYQAQHAPVAHFGLGNQTVDRLEVRWPGGAVSELKSPDLDVYHDIRAPATTEP